MEHAHRRRGARAPADARRRGGPPRTPGGARERIGRAVVDADILAPHAVVATPDGSIYAAEFGVYVASAGTPARRFVWKYTPNGAGGYRSRGWRGRRMVRRVVMGRPGRCVVMVVRRRARGWADFGLAVDAAVGCTSLRVLAARAVVSASGTIRTVEGPAGGLNVPEGLAYDATTNTVLVTDKRNNRLRSFPATDGGR
jgi:hypothetical protein